MPSLKPMFPQGRAVLSNAWNMRHGLPQRVTAVPNRLLSQNQTDLPQLPVPPLEKTLQKYLKTVKPLVTHEEYNVTKEIVEKFSSSNGLGTKLQSMLEARAKNHRNWLTDWWVETAYFAFRWPVVVWSSPGLVFPSQTFETLHHQIKFASKVITGALEYKSKVDDGTVPVDKMGGQALDMSQYNKVFGTYRMPGIVKDSIIYHCQGNNQPTHIVVAHNNHFFKLECYDKDGKPLHQKLIRTQLRNIVERSTHAAKPIGILTTQNRNVWGKAFKKLKKDERNAESLAEIEKSLFIVCLDGPIHKETGDKLTDAALECIHGNGPNSNAGNRWFDKTIQFVVGKKGHVGLTYEHSPAEGPPIANLMDYIFSTLGDKKALPSLPNDVRLPKAQRLTFSLSEDIEGEIATAQQALQSLVDDLQMTCFSFNDYGKEFIKSHQLSPDSYIQMCIQLAFYRIHKEPGAHYESASTRKFIDGRTETIRSCSEESVHFARTMLHSQASNASKVMALKEAIEAHKLYAKEAVNGLGVDRHLLGLKLSAIEAGMDVPALFMDVSYMRSSHMRLSTSNVPSNIDAFMCYGPLVPDGYGCCYNPRPNAIIFGTSALNSSPETDSNVFRTALEDSLRDMQNILIQDSVKSKL